MNEDQFQTIILGKRSYISKQLKKKLTNSKILSIQEFLKKKKEKTKFNIIINSSFPLKKLNNLKSYKKFFSKSLLEIIDLIEFIKSYKNINKIIFSSSSSVYSSFLKELAEDDFNRKLYSSVKNTLENLLNNFCKKKKINFYILRIFNVYGKNENFSIISKLNKKKIKVRIANNGKSIRDFIHIDDLTKVYKLFINKKILTGIYDVGTGKGVSVKKLINLSRSNNKNVTYIKKPIQEVSKSIASIEYFKKYNMRIKFKNVINYMAE
tara:strand:- start:12191 stop:12988 length:798 start_codon:yes stop_codon:yes gene_type:complete